MLPRLAAPHGGEPSGPVRALAAGVHGGRRAGLFRPAVGAAGLGRARRWRLPAMLVGCAGPPAGCARRCCLAAACALGFAAAPVRHRPGAADRDRLPTARRDRDRHGAGGGAAAGRAADHPGGRPHSDERPAAVAHRARPAAADRRCGASATGDTRPGARAGPRRRPAGLSRRLGPAARRVFRRPRRAPASRSGRRRSLAHAVASRASRAGAAAARDDRSAGSRAVLPGAAGGDRGDAADRQRRRRSRRPTARRSAIPGWRICWRSPGCISASSWGWCFGAVAAAAGAVGAGRRCSGRASRSPAVAALAAGGGYMLLTGMHVPILRSFAMACLFTAGGAGRAAGRFAARAGAGGGWRCC